MREAEQAGEWRQASLAAQHPLSLGGDARQEVSTRTHHHRSRQQPAVLYEETPLTHILPCATHILVPIKVYKMESLKEQLGVFTLS